MEYAITILRRSHRSVFDTLMLTGQVMWTTESLCQDMFFSSVVVLSVGGAKSVALLTAEAEYMYYYGTSRYSTRSLVAETTHY